MPWNRLLAATAAKLVLVRARNRKNKLAEGVTLGDPKRTGANWLGLRDIKVGKMEFFAEPVDVKRTVTIPRLPESLPKFDVTATVEITLKDGSKKTYSKTVNIDITK